MEAPALAKVVTITVCGRAPASALSSRFNNCLLSCVRRPSSKLKDAHRCLSSSSLICNSRTPSPPGTSSSKGSSSKHGTRVVLEALEERKRCRMVRGVASTSHCIFCPCPSGSPKFCGRNGELRTGRVLHELELDRMTGVTARHDWSGTVGENPELTTVLAALLHADARLKSLCTSCAPPLGSHCCRCSLFSVAGAAAAVFSRCCCLRTLFASC